MEDRFVPGNFRKNGVLLDKFYAAKVVEDTKELARIAKWVGAAIYEAGLRVPTLEGVEVAFLGDWIVRDDAGIVFVYTDEDFTREFTAV